MPDRIKIIPWGKPDPPEENALRDQMRRENLSPYAWSNNPEDRYPPHSHGYGKVIYVVRGSITWIFPETGEEAETRTGDRLELASGVVHAARVGPEGVTCLEAHLEEKSSG